ncbi:MAG: hypothetical protein NVS4B12_11680 [Ktedonobacteraceae bacterium]
MAVNDVVHMNECGLPLNAIEWLETHHQSKAHEREQMIRNLRIQKECFVIDAGCGPGLWTPLLARAIGPRGHIVGVDISSEALVTAQSRSANRWYRHQVEYKRALLEELPIPLGRADMIFSANVSQYLPDPVSTFAAMGPYLAQGGRLAVKDIDFGTMRFHGIHAGLQARVLQAREYWELQRVDEGYTFEDSWVGSKLAGYLRKAGYEDVCEVAYPIRRKDPLPKDFRFYLQGIAEWFVSEGAPLLSDNDIRDWLRSFRDGPENAIDQEGFQSEEVEYVVTGVWNQPTPKQRYSMDMYVELPHTESSELQEPLILLPAR